MCHCTEHKLSALQVRLSEKNKLIATTQQFITAKISGCALNTGECNTLITTSEQFTTAIQAALGLVKDEQLSIEGVRLDWLAHILVCKIEFF